MLGINDDPVTIKHIELAIIDRAWDEGWVDPAAPDGQDRQAGRRRSAPAPPGWPPPSSSPASATMSTVFERDDRIGGLLRYGIPDFKMEKWRIDRRLEQMEAEGVVFKPGVNVGVDVNGRADRSPSSTPSASAAAPPQARDLPIPGRDLEGHPLRDGLPAAPEPAGAGDAVDRQDPSISGRRASESIIIGGGDTGADCLGTVAPPGLPERPPVRDRPPAARRPRCRRNPWPQWWNTFKISSAHEEGGVREYSISTIRFLGEDGPRPRRWRPSTSR